MTTGLPVNDPEDPAPWAPPGAQVELDPEPQPAETDTMTAAIAPTARLLRLLPDFIGHSSLVTPR
jgi:hypothetical protein